AILLVILVLLHSPKGDGLAGIGGQAQLFSSSKSAEQNLNRITWTVATLFLSISVVLGAGWLSAATGP
ncbi:preprotein translocase subunit SecG, partial [Synechococcus sp. R55.7]